MIPLTLLEITSAVRGVLDGFGETCVEQIVTDSRKITPGCLFVALQGDRFDGHDYIASAYEQGCVCVISHKPVEPPTGKAAIIVKDTKRALMDLAAYYREQFYIPVVGITGSVGKTTTKEFIYSVLSQGFCAIKTEGNFNNEIGLPLTVFRLERETQLAVLEMGMSGFGEIANLTAIAKPYIGVITNIGTAHIENLGSREGILKAKMEIAQGIAPGGYLVLNGDEPLLRGATIKKGITPIYYGVENQENDFYATNIQSFDDHTIFEVRGRMQRTVRINTVGVHNVYNALAAMCVGFLLGIGPEKMQEGLLAFQNAAMRQNIYQKNGITIIDDCYNANPDSMKAALKVLAGKEGKKIAVLGDMLELGSYSQLGHNEVGACARQLGIDLVLCYGEESRYIAEGFVKNRDPHQKAAYFSDKEMLAQCLKSQLCPGDVVLFKGSRGMKMEELIPMLDA